MAGKAAAARSFWSQSLPPSTRRWENKRNKHPQTSFLALLACGIQKPVFYSLLWCRTCHFKIKFGCDITNNNINSAHRFVSQMYVWLNKSTITISDCIDTKCTACDFKGLIFHPSSKCSFLCLFLGTDWQISGILHTVRCYLSQLANRLECSFSSRSHRLHTQPRGFFLQNRVSDLVHGPPIASIRTPLQDPVTNILPAVWPIQHLCATHYLFFHWDTKWKHSNSERQKWEQQPVLLIAQHPHLCMQISACSVFVLTITNFM